MTKKRITERRQRHQALAAMDRSNRCDCGCLLPLPRMPVRDGGKVFIDFEHRQDWMEREARKNKFT